MRPPPITAISISMRPFACIQTISTLKKSRITGPLRMVPLVVCGSDRSSVDHPWPKTERPVCLALHFNCGPYILDRSLILQTARNLCIDSGGKDLIARLQHGIPRACKTAIFSHKFGLKRERLTIPTNISFGKERVA